MVGGCRGWQCHLDSVLRRIAEYRLIPTAGRLSCGCVCLMEHEDIVFLSKHISPGRLPYVTLCNLFLLTVTTQENAIPTAALVTSALVVAAGVSPALRRRLLKEKGQFQTPVRLADRTDRVVCATPGVQVDTLDTGLSAEKSE